MNVTLGGVITTTGHVSVTATSGSILDGDSTGSVDIVANGLRLWAGTGIGQLGGSVNPIETTVTTVSGRAGSGGISLRETNTLIVGDTSATIKRVSVNASVSDVTDATQSDLVTSANGSIVLRVVTGNLTLNDGTAADNNIAVSAHGTGNILRSHLPRPA